MLRPIPCFSLLRGTWWAAVLLGLCSAAVPAAEDLQHGWGYRNDSSGIFPDDCKPVTEWQEFSGTIEVPHGKRTITRPDPASPPAMKNIVWKTPLPNLSESSPLSVGKRVFTLCEPGWPQDHDAPSLLCLDGESGEILWQKPIDQFDTLPASEQTEAKRMRSEYWKGHRDVRSYQMRLNAAMTASDTATYERLLAEAEKAGYKGLVGKYKKGKPVTLFAGQCGWGGEAVEQALKKYRLAYPTWGYTTVGVTFATPCTDGELIYVATGYGAVAAFDLDGNMQWMNWLFEPERDRKQITLNSSETASSPIVVNGRVLWQAFGWMFALDPATGKLIWEYQVDKETLAKICDPAARVGTAVAMRVDGTDIVFFSRGYALRIADGKPLGEPLMQELYGMGHQTYVFDRERQTLFFGTGAHGTPKQYGKRDRALKLAMDGERLVGTYVWESVEGDAGLGDVTAVHYRGFIYQPYGGRNAATGASIRGSRFPPIGHGLLVVDGRLWGGLSGPAHQIAHAAILGEGRFDQPVINDLGHHGPFDAQQLEKMAAYGTREIGEWYHWAVGRGYPFFSGNRIFIRTFDHLYCIGDKNQPFVPSKAFAAEDAGTARSGVEAGRKETDEQPQRAAANEGQTQDRQALRQALDEALAAGKTPSFRMSNTRSEVQVIAL